jgi:hypothetical protein
MDVVIRNLGNFSKNKRYLVEIFISFVLVLLFCSLGKPDLRVSCIFLCLN